MRFFSSPAYTLVELLIALSLSLILLLAVTIMFRNVGATMNDTRSAMAASAQITEAALLLRQDLARIDGSLATKPFRLVHNRGEEISDDNGYLEIIEGPNSSSSHPFWDAQGELDMTVGDTDDMIAFTIRGSAIPFRGLIRDESLHIEERTDAEIVWFVRGNTLYRRVRLLNDLNPARTDNHGYTVRDLVQRENRTLHKTYAQPVESPTNQFPFPLYDHRPQYRHWYYLRMPLLEETLHPTWQATARQWKTVGSVGQRTDNPDLWEQPYFYPNNQNRLSGALNEFVSSPRHHRAGEDVVLTNVLSFDIQFWCHVTMDFVDLGTGSWRRDEGADLHGYGGLVWDSWSRYDFENRAEPPPFHSQPLEAIRITIRNFDPSSQEIKQVTVVHQF